jgi:hypothetical protein
VLLIQSRHRNHEGALRALARDDDFAVLAAFENGIQAVQAQAALLPLISVAAEARGLKDGANVLGIGEALLFGGGREFADIDVGCSCRPGSGSGQADSDNTLYFTHCYWVF